MTAAQKQARAEYLFNRLTERETELHIILARYRGQQRIAACDLDGLRVKSETMAALASVALVWSIEIDAVLRECGR